MIDVPKSRFDAARSIGRALRECPEDFEAVFVRIGRLASEEHYHAGQDTVTRWLTELGKFRLIEMRRAHVRQRASEQRIGRRKAKQVRKLEAATMSALSIPDPRIAALAADYLRTRQGGGWQVSLHADGDWIVGIARKSAADLLSKAERYGFDTKATTLRAERDDGVEGAR